MARPSTIQNSALLDAARTVFLEKGFQASTAQIARRAGVSEGSIFKHFKTKMALFLAAMQVDEKNQAWRDRLTRSIGNGDIRASLVDAMTQLVQLMRTILPRIIMVRSSGISVPCAYHSLETEPLIQHQTAITAYFHAEIKQGRLTLQKPDVQAHALIGALFHYVFCETLFDYRPASVSAYVRAVVDGLLRGSGPAAPGSAAGCARTRRPPVSTMPSKRISAP